MSVGGSVVETHQVFNQPQPLENFNAFSSDKILQHWLSVFAGTVDTSILTGYGHQVGHELLSAGFEANTHKPEFVSHDRFGRRIDLVKFHPAYHQLMDRAIQAGIHAIPWAGNPSCGHALRAAMEYMHNQADSGSGCPLTMTFACVPTISHSPDVAAQWLPKITARQYDERNIPYFEKNGLTIGMAMTEKQGGSDVRANTTWARPVAEPGNGAAYRITGHKWFCSAPMCDGFLVLAQTGSGLSCFLLPRWCPDGSKNTLFIQRLKNKLGNCSNASSEVEFREAFAWLIGEEGRGVPTIIEMVSLTRFDCMVGSSALMRAATAQALHHTSGRSVFGKGLHQQPLMCNVLADLAIEAEAALALSMRVAYALDNIDDEQQKLFARVATAIGKYWICKRVPNHAYEAMECIGEVGYVEDNLLPRIYREAPVNAIWEGSGNVQCLDVLRAFQKEPQSLQVILSEISEAAALDTRMANFVSELHKELNNLDSAELKARRIVEKLALALQASLLLQSGDSDVAEAFVSSRIAADSGLNYGTLNCAEALYQRIMQRARPDLNGA